MNITDYFIKHPVIAVVLNVMIAVVGYLSLESLTVREYPAVHFPEAYINTYYPNASAEMIEHSITNPLEDRLSGIEGIETITSDSQHGASHITLTFKNGTSIDKSFTAIREAISLVVLPTGVKPPIIERKTASANMPFIIIALKAPAMDLGSLTHYASLNLKNSFRSIKGAATVEVWGQPYTYNIVLDAKKLHSFGVNVEEVFNALEQGRLSLPAGKFQNATSITLNSALKTIQDYENLVVKEIKTTAPKSPAILLKQVADISLQADSKDLRVRINGKPGLCIAIRKANDANPLEVSGSVQEKLAELRPSLPAGMKIDIISDQADFVRQSLKNVRSSIGEACLFVLIIVFFFLRNIKATVIPLVTVPLSLVGCFIFLKAFGFSINIMTLLAMVLAIGLVVDDAIIVLENIQRHIDEGLQPFKAARQGAYEIGFAIIAMTLTLASVYAPIAFITGALGELFIEFAVALAGSVFISGVVAITLSPLMCAKILRPQQTRFWPQIDAMLEYLVSGYKVILRQFLLYRKACWMAFLVSLCGISWLVKVLPREIAPKEDRNLIGVYIPPVAGNKDINDMEQKSALIERKLMPLPEATYTNVFLGDWGGSIVVQLTPQESRARSAQTIVDSLRPLVSAIPSLEAYPWSYDSGLPGLDESMGEELSLVISNTDSYSTLFAAVEKAQKALTNEFPNLRFNLNLNTPSYRIDMDTHAMSRLNLTPKQVAKTVEVFFSGDDRSLNFAKDGILYAITLKGKQAAWGLDELSLTNHAGKRISLGAIAKLIATAEPDKLYHHNQMRSVTLSTELPKNQSFGNAMKRFYSEVSKELPPTYKKTWTGAAKFFGESQKTMFKLFFLAIIFIYAILAVQFENFIDPLIILLTVPLACLGGLILLWLSGGSLNIYTEIGLITLIGLITKHGILIVEFANQLRQKTDLYTAIIEASSLRLRPILMTTSAMVFGAIPLILSTDAGHEAQRAIGIVLVGGLVCGTFFTLFILPTVCCMIKSFVEEPA